MKSDILSVSLWIYDELKLGDIVHTDLLLANSTSNPLLFVFLNTPSWDRSMEAGLKLSVFHNT